MRYRNVTMIGVVCLVGLLRWGEAAGPPAGAPARVRPDLQQLKNSCEVFEGIINTALSQVIQHPLFLTEKTRGVYLEDYGLSFTLAINLNRGFLLFPPSNAKGLVDKNPEKTMELVRTCLTEALWRYGNGLRQLPGDQKISIIAHVLNRNLDTGASLNRILVLSVSVRDLPGADNGKTSLEDFKRKVKCFEY